MDELEPELEAILSQSDEDVMFAELHRLYNYTDDDSRQFTRHQMVVALSHGFNNGKEHIEMLRKAEAKIAADTIDSLLKRIEDLRGILAASLGEMHLGGQR